MNWKIKAGLSVAGIAALFYFAAIEPVHPQEKVIPQSVSGATIEKAAIGDVLMRRGAVETRKTDASGKLNAKVYSGAQWDMTGEPLVKFDATTGRVYAKSRYVQYIPDAATRGLIVNREVGNTGVKEFYTVPDDKTTKLSWTVETDAESVEWNASRKMLTFRGFLGLYMFDTPPPVSWDADKKLVGMTVEYKDKVLTYTILPGTYRYPVTVDPTTTVTSQAGLNGNALQTNAIYLTARNGTGGSASTSEIAIGQEYPGYNIQRGFLCFPVIPAMSTVSACTLYVDGSFNQSDTDFNLNIVGARAWKSVLATDDYTHFNGWAASGTYTGTILNDAWGTASYSAGWNKLIFNSDGRDSLVAASGDSLWIAALSSRDYTPTTPTRKETVFFTGGTSPYISFTYEEAASGFAGKVSGITLPAKVNGVTLPLKISGVQ